MGKLADQARQTPIIAYQRCGLAIACERHPEHADDLRTIIADRTIRPIQIVAACRQHGIDLPAKTISRHRNGECVHCTNEGHLY